MFESAALVAFVPVSDLARARSFYEGTLGLTVQDADEFGALLNSHGTPVRLAVVDEHTPATFARWMVAVSSCIITTGWDRMRTASGPHRRAVGSPGSPTARATRCPSRSSTDRHRGMSERMVPAVLFAPQ